MKKISLILSVIFITAVACETTPKKTPPEQSAGLKLPNGVSVRETPRGSVLNLSSGREVKFRFDRSIEIGNYEDAYNLVYQIINDNPSIRIMVEGNSSKEGRARYNYKSKRQRRYLHIRCNRSEKFNRCVHCGRAREKRCYGLYNHCFVHRVRACTAPVYRALFGLCYGRIFYAQGQGRFDSL